MTPDLFLNNRLSNRGPRRSGVKCGRGYIKRSKHIRTIGIATSSLLVLLTTLAIFPIVSHNDSAEATFVPATTTLSIVSSKNTASVDVTPVSSTGTFATSSADNMAEFTVTTDNLTGYSVTLLGSDASGQLVNDTTGDTLDSITADTTENDFRTGSASTYNNKWGYRLNINNTTTTNFLSAPTSTTVAKTIYSTTGPNTNGTSDSFTLGLGARIDYTKPTGTYTNTFIITAIANNISYQINYLDSDTTTTLLPSDAESNISASSIELNSTTPTKSGYEFKGWCDGTLSSDGTSCTGTPGTIYQPGDTYTFTTLSSTTSNIANLYAMWEDTSPTMQDFTPAQCSTLASSGNYTLKDVRDNNTYTVRYINGNCWMTQNLRFIGDKGSTTGSMIMKAATSNINADTTINYTDLTTGDTYDAARIHVATPDQVPSGATYTAEDMGVWYNYAAASAMTITGSSNSTQAVESVCPAGWRLPTNAEHNGLTGAGDYKTKYNFVGGGTWVNGGTTNKNWGYWWNSAASSATDRYMLYSVDTGTQLFVTGLVRSSGRYIRCVLQPTMQNFTTQEAESMATGETKTLADSRDNQTYTVAKLGDGNVWMTRNLAIGCNGTGSTYGNLISQKTLTPADSNISSSYTTSATNLSAGNSYDNDYQTCSSTYGAWYNYAAATAKTITGSTNTDESTYDICPKGWRLPSNTENAALVSKIGSSPASFNPVGGGYYADGRLNASDGRWWSSTAYNTISRYRLYYSGSALNTSDFIQRNYGTYVRCIKDTSDLPVMQNISTAELNALVPNTGDITTLIDNRDGEKYKVGRLADGNVWLLENLRLDISDPTVQANLTSATTNADNTTLGYLKNGGGTSPYPANGVIAKTASGGSWVDDFANPYIATQYKDTIQAKAGNAPAGKIGIFYNFCAVSAGSYCYGSGAGTGNATQDICPAGWRIPTMNSATDSEFLTLCNAYAGNCSPYTNNNASFVAALSTPLSGEYGSNSRYYSGERGYYWTSSYSNNTSIYSLYVNSNQAYPAASHTIFRHYGASIRCLAK